MELQHTKDNDVWTGFHYACFEGKSGMVKILIENATTFGININTKDKDGSTGFHQAYDTDLVKIFMNTHFASVHEGKKPFKCDICDYSLQYTCCNGS